MRYSGAPRLQRTLRRLRHDTDMLRRAGREIGNGALPAGVATPWCQAAESAARTLSGIEGLLADEDIPRDFDTLAPAYLGALKDIRKSGKAATLPSATLRRMFEIGFTLDQLRRDVGDMIEIAREIPKSRPGLVATMKGWTSVRG